MGNDYKENIYWGWNGADDLFNPGKYKWRYWDNGWNQQEDVLIEHCPSDPGAAMTAAMYSSDAMPMGTDEIPTDSGSDDTESGFTQWVGMFSWALGAVLLVMVTGCIIFRRRQFERAKSSMRQLTELSVHHVSEESPLSTEKVIDCKSMDTDGDGYRNKLKWELL